MTAKNLTSRRGTNSNRNLMKSIRVLAKLENMINDRLIGKNHFFADKVFSYNCKHQNSKDLFLFQTNY